MKFFAVVGNIGNRIWYIIYIRQGHNTASFCERNIFQPVIYSRLYHTCTYVYYTNTYYV